jgi:succinoglycan biosynthesis protein ExoA
MHQHAAQPSTDRVLVVIPTLNESANVARVIEDLYADLPQTVPVRFVVADGGSTDGTQEIVREQARHRPALHLLDNPKRLQSVAVNLAVQTHGADADVLIRCDAHAKYPRGYVRRLLASLDEHRADAVVVPMDTVGDTCVRRAVAWVSDTVVGSGGSAHRGGQRSGFVDHGHHAAFRMASFVRAGGYDESFTHNEDAELDCRQRALGSRIFLDASIRLGYQPRSTLGGLWRQYFGYGKGRSRTVRRHPGSMRLRQLAVPLHVALCVLSLALLPWSPWLLLWPATYAMALVATSVMLVLRHRSLCGLLAGVAAGVMHFGWAAGLFWGLATVREAPWSVQQARPLRPIASGSPLRDAIA